MRKNKIKLIISINDFLVGGAQKLILNQLKYFDRDNFEITLLTLFEFPDRANFYNLLPPDVHLVRFKFSGFKDFHSLIDLLRFLKAYKPDVVCTHLFFSNTLIKFIKPLVGYKVISVEHNTYTGNKLWQIITDKVLSVFTFRIIAVSKSVMEFASKQTGISRYKFEIVYNGVDLEKIKISRTPRAEARKKLGFNNLTLLNMGRLTNQKNQLSLIEGFDSFHKGYPDSKLVIVGEGSMYFDLQDRIRELGAEKYIELHGYRENVFDYYSASDYLVSSSFIEGLSMAYLEAMSCGLPIVATRTAGTDEIVVEGKNGFFIDGYRSDDVCRALGKVILASREKLSDASIEMAKNYSAEANVKKYERLFLESLNENYS